MIETTISLQRKLFIFFLVSITTVLGLIYGVQHDVAGMFWPAAGFYTAYTYVYRKQIVPYILIALFVTYLSFVIIQVDDDWYMYIIMAFTLTIGNAIEMFLFTYFIDKTKIDVSRLSDVSVGVPYTLIALAVVLVGAILPITIVRVVLQPDNTFQIFMEWIIGNYLGILLFGSNVLYSIYRDKPTPITIAKTVKVGLYLGLYSISLFFVFGHSGNDFISIENFQIWILVFYVYTAFNFPYWMVVLNNLLFLAAAYIFHMSNVSMTDFLNEGALIAVYLTILSVVGSVIKNVLVEREQNQKDLVVARANLETIIISINDMFKTQNKLPDEVRQLGYEYHADMFRLACEIYPKFEYASCFIKGEQTVHFLAAKGYNVDYLNQVEFDIKQFLWLLYDPEVVRNEASEEAIINEDNQVDFRHHYPRIKESLRFNVQLDENLIGGMSFDIMEGSKETFDEADLQYFKSFQNVVNSYYSIVIQNKQNNSLKNDIVHSLVRTLEMYDAYTGSHSEEVSAIAVELGRHLQVSNEEIQVLYWAGLVHDIGKVGVSSDILNKTTRLTKEEYELIRKHPVVGYDILSKSSGLQGIASIVRYHHEWWDGSGYPDQKKESDIPYLSLILHMADAVSAMSIDRVYKKAMTDDEIITEIKRGIGTQFSPKVAVEMIRIIEGGTLQDILRQYRSIETE